MRNKINVILGIFLLVIGLQFASASAISSGCNFKAEIIGSDAHTLLKITNITNDKCDGKVANNEIYSFNDSSGKIKSGMIIQIEEQGACPMTPSGEAICNSWWQPNYTIDPVYDFSIGKLSCQKDSDCFTYGTPSKADCGGCEGDTCFEYNPDNCNLYKNNITCQKNSCISNGIITEKTIKTETFWQKILNWFKRLFN